MPLSKTSKIRNKAIDYLICEMRKYSGDNHTAEFDIFIPYTLTFPCRENKNYVFSRIT